MREYITEHAIANAIRMKRAWFSGVFLVVEGVSDKLVYGLVLDHESCRVEIAHGREKVLATVRILNIARFSGVLGIVDADFSNITGEYPAEDNILQTDLHDLECMMLNSPAFDRLLDEFGSNERISAFSMTNPLVARQLAAKASPLGCLRLLSLQQELGLTFEDLTFSRFVNATNLDIDLPEMVREIVNKSRKHHLDQDQLLRNISSEKRRGHDCWQISCGHDILGIVSFGFRKTFAGKSSGSVAVDVLERSLRLAYEGTYLKETRLYRAMTDWEQQHPGFTLLSAS